ncbi:MAG: NAD(P)/FAD-dependent oxidoreductase [Deltaproteobacteria bacterium]|nr:NAD(P)/FAD-dependent oxidoreductase [Deltaproteobacteria bacterium]
MDKKITIIGTGVAALTSVRNLRKLDSSIEITVIGKKPEFVYLPSLIWIPSGIRRSGDLIIPLDNFFRRMKVNFYEGEATGLKDGGRTVITDSGEISNDGLIIATGGRFIKKLPGIENVITPCEGIAAAEAIRDKVKAMKEGTIAFGFSGNPKEPGAMRGGPIFEFLFGMDAQLRKEKRRDRFKLVFFTPAPEPGKRLGPGAVKGLLESMASRNIETYLGHKIKSFETKKIITEAEEIQADLTIFMPGMTGNSWFDNTDLPRSPGGLIEADEHCGVTGFDCTYVAGDSGSFPGPPWMPKQAHMADLQAKAAAKNLINELYGKKPTARFKTELMCIVDNTEKGMLVFRTENRNIVMPNARLWHWSKRFFEWWYLRRYR